MIKISIIYLLPIYCLLKLLEGRDHPLAYRQHRYLITQDKVIIDMKIN